MIFLWPLGQVVFNGVGAAVPFVLHRFFLEPLSLDRYWLLMLLPLVGSICVVYKTIKIDDMAQLPRGAALLAGQVVFFMVVAAAVLWLITWLVQA